MPELPEVETVVRDLQKILPGLAIEDVSIYDNRIIHTINDKQFIKTLKGKVFKSVTRRAKGIIITFETGDYLFIHLKMTGQLIYGEDLRLKQNLKETKVVLQLSDKKFLNYNDQRLFGWLIYTKDLSEIGYLNNVGPEPFDDVVTGDWFKEKVRSRKVPIKVLLLNQEFIAGVGNIYASEILYKAKINPRKRSFRLTKKECLSLRDTTVDILKEAILCRGTSFRNYRDSSGREGTFLKSIKVYNNAGKECAECKDTIQRIFQSGRSTFFCNTCQK
ncbi:MAG: formamidopyrimidine-DNA glycosylase [Lysobacterales bacterium]|jgi:formamidopyrimidine-DNA glycosylase